MTITYVGAGTATLGNNTPVAPGAVAGIAVNDLALIEASIRNTAAAITTPAGWQIVGTVGNVALFGRFWQTGDSMPTVAFTGGATGDDTIARAIALRGVALDALDVGVETLDTNATSNTSIAYSALNVPGAGHAVVMASWRQDDAGTASTPSGFTQVGLTAATAGNDASQILYYSIQTTEADIASGSITITGGVAAISRNITAAFKPLATVTAVEQNVFPPRVLVTVTNLAVGDSVAVYRKVGSEYTLLRAGSELDATDPSFLVLDAELPFGTPVSYRAIVNGSAIYDTTPATHGLPGGKVVLSDAINGLSAEVVILAWPDKAYDSNSTLYRAGSRNIVVSGALGQFSSTIQLYTEFSSSADNVRAMLASATSNVIQLRQAGPYDGVDAYVAVLGYTEQRYSQDGSDERRTFSLTVAEVDGWAASLEALGFTYADLQATYTGLTYATLTTDYPTYLALAQADLS